MNNNLNKTIREQRKEAVIKTFFETVKKMSASNPCVTNKEILAKAVNEEAPRFFINYESARRFISLMARKKKLPVVNKNKLAMYKEIYRRYKERNNDVETLCAEEGVEDIAVILRDNILQAGIHTYTNECQREEEC